MLKNDSSIKIFVFIARDATEYAKYQLAKGEKEEHGRDANVDTGFQWRFDASSKVLRLVINKGSIEHGLDRLRAPAPNVEEDFRDKERLAVLLDMLRLGHNDVETDVEIAVEDVFIDATSSDLSGGLWTVLQSLKDEDNNPIIKGKEVQGRIFIHWGGGERDSILFYERKVTEALPPDWRLYSLGTNRNDLFPVDGESIIVPCAFDELQKLEKKFSGGSDLEHIKEILTDYIVANEECRSLTKRAKPKLYDYDFTAEQSDSLKAFFMSFTASYDNPAVVKSFAKCWALQEFLRGNKTKLPFSEEVVELFSSLLREGICHE